MASHSRMLPRNWLPRPSPWLAPFSRPAMSTKLMRAGMICADLAITASLSRRASGTATSPVLGSMVQNGKLAAWALAVRVRALNSVDLPTLGRPTIPILKPMEISGKAWASHRAARRVSQLLVLLAQHLGEHGGHRAAFGRFGLRR